MAIAKLPQNCAMYYTIHYPNNTFSSKKVMPNMQNNYLKKFSLKQMIYIRALFDEPIV